MKRTLIIALACLASPAGAQQSAFPVPFAPITIDQKAYEDMRRMLGQMRLDDALQAVIFWEQLERTAQQKTIPAPPPAPAAGPSEAPK